MIIADLAPKFSAPEATAHPWEEARSVLQHAELYWFATVKPDGQPHVTPLLSVWDDGALHIATGPDERKALNLAANPRCTITTGVNTHEEGVDVVLEGTAERVTDDEKLRHLAGEWEEKYGDRWHFDAADGSFHQDGRVSHVFRIAPSTAFAFVKSEVGSQTRYTFK